MPSLAAYCVMATPARDLAISFALNWSSSGSRLRFARTAMANNLPHLANENLKEHLIHSCAPARASTHDIVTPWISPGLHNSAPKVCILLLGRCTAFMLSSRFTLPIHFL